MKIRNCINYLSEAICLHMSDDCVKDVWEWGFVKFEKFSWALRMWVSLLGLPNVGKQLLFEGRAQVWKINKKSKIKFEEIFIYIFFY